MTENSLFALPLLLPTKIPSSIAQPKFQLGEQVKWSQAPNPDFGWIIGVVYTHEASCQITGLHYLILLNEQSPSRFTCTHDFAFESDLERLEQNRSAVGEALT